jgi:hypothetical protein
MCLVVWDVLIIYMTGETWSKFHSAHPLITFDDFWTVKLRSYKKRNTAVKAFFTEFERDLVRCTRILADRALHREIRRVKNSSIVPYILPKGLKKPKLEPVETETEPLEFMYRVP